MVAKGVSIIKDRTPAQAVSRRPSECAIGVSAAPPGETRSHRRRITSERSRQTRLSEGARRRRRRRRRAGAGRLRARSIRRRNRRRRCAIRDTASGPRSRSPKPSASAVRTPTSGSRATASQSLGVRNGQISTAAASAAAGSAAAARRHDRDLRLRRPRDSQRRVGLRQQPAGHARGDQARHRRRHRRRARQRDREEDATCSSAPVREVRRVLADADREGSVDGAARGEGRAAAQRHRDDAEDTRRCCSRSRRSSFEHEWKYLATSEGSFIEQVFHFMQLRRVDATARTGHAGQDAQLRAAGRRRLRVPAEVRPARARPSASPPRRSSTRWPSRSARASRISCCCRRTSALTIHEIVAHATEARSHRRLRGELRRHELREDRRRRQAEIRLAEVQRHRRPHLPDRHGDGRLRRRRREGAEVADREGRHPRRPADQPRDRAPRRREGQPRLHVRQPLAQLSVPADAEHPARAGPDGIADRRRR